MNLYELTIAAEAALSTYVSPDIDEWRTSIDPVLKALGEPQVGNDKVSAIKFSRETVFIETTYSVRCCQQTSEMKVPLAVLKADDPAGAAAEHRVQQEIREAKSRLASALRSVEEWRQKIAKLSKESSSLVQQEGDGENQTLGQSFAEGHGSALQAEIDRLLAAMKQAAEEIRKCDYTPARSTLLVAMSRAKAAPSKQES